MANNREISQFAGLVTVNDTNNNVSLASTLSISASGGGRLGVGVTLPNANLHVGHQIGGGVGNASNPAIQIGGDTTYRLGFYTDSETGYIDAANGDNGLAIHTKTAGEAVRIASNGNVGFGTDDPDIYSLATGRISAFRASSGISVLNLVGENTAASYLQFGNDSIRRGSLHFVDGSDFVISTNASDSGTSLTDQVRLTNSGDLLIGGTLPSSPNIQLSTGGYGYFNGGTIRIGSSVYTSCYTGSTADTTGSDARFTVSVTFPETGSYDNPFTVEVMAAHPLYDGNVVHYKVANCYKSSNNVVDTAIISENNTNTLTVSDSSSGGNRTIVYNSRRPISNTGTAVNCAVYIIVTGGIVPTSVLTTAI